MSWSSMKSEGEARMADVTEAWSAHVRLAMLICLSGAAPEDIQRRRFLDTLAGAPGESATGSLLADLLGITREQVAAIAVTLAAAGLVEVERGAVFGVYLTEAGRAVSAGQDTVSGVAGDFDSAVLADALNCMALRVTVADVLCHLDFLREHDLVDDDYRITDGGRLVVRGLKKVAGVKVPSRATMMRAAAAAARAKMMS